MTLLDYISSIVNKNKISDLSSYSQFPINAYFSKFRNCLFVVNAVNMFPNISNKMHYDFLFNNIPYGWQKKFEYEKDEITKTEQLIIDYFKINKKYAKEYVDLLTKDELQDIKDYNDLGGKVGK